ncbi:MAG: hypothetical protein A2086_10085 [Spirochaetes bacterium GWD1_27_9]|nr:MAG: hypothetical protein A2Z98_05530 [Spirochaetes bacterium GWB1_27_13]OHD23730.1 MAG: hypothetical protein A2Y34_17650 [Spirochaetes bacterium GWC1_27_15]OHD42278.1 MAG: hypothetical protein A2086_10085 [Spirochaetes bacterium GWD1_27_9]
MKKESLLSVLKNQFGFDEKKSIGLILSGLVLVDDKVIDKTGFLIKPSSKIRFKKIKEYVSRGAYKLLTIFDNFSLSVKDKICFDVGSSTGGFTEILLEKDVKKVYAIDCGQNQLDYSLRTNPKVVSIENKRISDLKNTDINDVVDFAVMDLSFTSSVPAIQHLDKEFSIKQIIVLIKPQFEYERLTERLNLTPNFSGIVENDTDRLKIIEFIQKEIKEIGYDIKFKIESQIKGTKGNIEYLWFIDKSV